jgi:hypothetical protein
VGDCGWYKLAGKVGQEHEVDNPGQYQHSIGEKPVQRRPPAPNTRHVIAPSYPQRRAPRPTGDSAVARKAGSRTARRR